MRTILVRCAIAAALLLLIPALARAQAMSTDVAQLVAQEGALDDSCRGGSGDDPATTVACAKRDAVVDQLKSKGWCYGSQLQIEADKRWQPCNAPTDPYAKDYARTSAAIYEADRAQFLGLVKDLYFAVSCQVFASEAGILPLIHDQGELLGREADASHIIDKGLSGLMQKAARDGADAAKAPASCEYWRAHPERVYTLRQAATVAMPP